VLKPGGLFYAEEVFAAFIDHAVTRRLLEHPREDRFDRETFPSAFTEVGLHPRASEQLWRSFGWFVAQNGNENGDR